MQNSDCSLQKSQGIGNGQRPFDCTAERALLVNMTMIQIRQLALLAIHNRGLTDNIAIDFRIILAN